MMGRYPILKVFFLIATLIENVYSVKELWPDETVIDPSDGGPPISTTPSVTSDIRADKSSKTPNISNPYQNVTSTFSKDDKTAGEETSDIHQATSNPKKGLISERDDGDDPLDLHMFYGCKRESCTGRCDGHARLGAGDEKDMFGEDCSCDDRCFLFGECCFDFFSVCLQTNLTSLLAPVKDITDTGKLIYEILGNKSLVKGDSSMFLYRSCQPVLCKGLVNRYWMVSDCQEGADGELRIKCRGTLSDALSSVPASLKRYPDLVFRNIYCALCNGLQREDLILWETMAKCPNKKKLRYEELLEMLKSSACMIESTPPNGHQPHRCKSQMNDILKQCPLEDGRINHKGLQCRSYSYKLYGNPDEEFPNWHCGTCAENVSLAKTNFSCDSNTGHFTFHKANMPLCPDKSCKGFCLGEQKSTIGCTCDVDCLLYGDCCFDFVSQCIGQNYTLMEVTGNETLISTLLKPNEFQRECYGDISDEAELVEYENSRKMFDPEENTTHNPCLENEPGPIEEEVGEKGKDLRLLYIKYGICHRLPLPDRMLWVIGKCPDGNKDSLCYRKDTRNRTLIAPVSMRGHSNVVFKNIYCAFCHGIPKDNLKPWLTLIRCDEPVTEFESEESLLREGICSISVMERTGGRQCFETDQFDSLDRTPLSMKLCKAYRYPVYSGKIVLRNPHCAKSFTEETTCTSANHKEIDVAGPEFEYAESVVGGLGILFNFNGDSLDFTSDSGEPIKPPLICNADEVYDHVNEICKRLHCQSGKVAVNGSCVANGTWFANEKDMIFPNGSMMYTINAIIFTSNSYRISELESMIQGRLKETFLEIETVSLSDFSTPTLDLFENKSQIKNNKTAAQVLRIIFKKSGTLEKHLEAFANLIAKSHDFLSYEGTTIHVTLQNYESDHTLQCSFGVVTSLSNATLAVLDDKLFANESGRFYPLDNIPFILDISTSNPILKRGYVCEIPLDCDPVAYNVTDFVLTDGNLQSQHSDLVLVNGSFFVSGEQVFFCHNFSNGPVNRRVTLFFKFDPVQDILTYVSSGISLLSLAATLVVYVILPQLRNLPGRLTMSLSVSLFLAQGLLLLIQQPKGVLCQIHAIFLHYFWLCSFMWMTLMSVNVARIFSNQLKGSSSENITVTHAKFAIFALGVPAIIVMTSVLLEYLDLAGVEIGYGARGVCWIANSRASLLLFGVPLALMLLVNLMAFVVTFYNIEKGMRNSQAISSTRADRNKVLIYFKLFVMMGLTWGFSFVAAFADVAVLWYLFIVMNGLQGFYILTSFICTSRVRALLMKKLKSTDSESSNSTKTHSISKI